ncbi:hypothetical protein LARI1_G000587 [Lachnellula arida]|uniref:AB hydrolase-1 domain-containing protein n=1 Tax=Lachnellula arida TaxID=1316785 RepID=A0A8T9BSB4_9HELO|nr:hypothetical protein LARI1_G000587 [Lachnellula arida]
MATLTPLQDSHSGTPPSVSMKTFHIAGILADVYGLDEVSPSSKSISCLWLLHPRLQTKQIMGMVASTSISDWNQRAPGDRKVGLIAVAFDQRNHGTREVKAIANESWKSGNETHAQDMFRYLFGFPVSNDLVLTGISIFHGTALDTSLLIDHLGSYVFNEPDSPPIEQHMVMGVSLGGHAAWQVLFNDPRVMAGVVIVGCPDYMRIMTDRARLSKRSTYTQDNLEPTFLSSPDFPQSLITACSNHDPKALLFGTSPIPIPTNSSPSPPSPHPHLLSSSEQQRLRPILNAKLKGKRILVCSGGADNLVPYHCSEPFLRFLKHATGKGGWYADGDVVVEDQVYEGVGHTYSEGMVIDTRRFITDALANGAGISSNL